MMISEKITDKKQFNLYQKVEYLMIHHSDFNRFEVDRNITVEGRSGKKYCFNYILRGENSVRIGVIIKDWRCSCSYMSIFKTERMLKDVTAFVDRIMLIYNTFSDAARAWADKLNFSTLSDGEIMSILNSDMRIAVNLS